MDDKNVVDHEQTLPNNPIVKPIKNPKVQGTGLTAVLLFLVLILIALTGYFAYQNMQLQKQLSNSKMNNLNSYSSPTLTSQTNNITISLPVTVLQTGYGIGPRNQGSYPKSVNASIPQNVKDQLTAYGVADKIIIGPASWTGSGSVGADGGSGGILYPVGGSDKSGPSINFSISPACVGCADDAGAAYFEQARQLDQQAEQGLGVSNFQVPQPPVGIVSKSITPNLVQYSLPNTSDGMEVNGIAFFAVYDMNGKITTDVHGQPYFTGMRVKLPSSQHSLALQILNIYVQRNNLDNPDAMGINGLIENFYIALTQQDGKKMFSYMTPPSTSTEQSDYDWLIGANLGANAFYRVFLRTKILNPQIGTMQKVNDTTYQVSLTDQIQGYSNAGNTVGTWSNPQTRNITIRIVNSNNQWLIDKYTDTSNTTNSGNAGTPKYNGFGQ